MNIHVDRDICTSCGLCVRACSFSAVAMENRLPVFNASCCLCGACVQACPVDAIAIERKIVHRDLSLFSGVFAFVERARDSVKPVSLEVLSAARRIAEKLGQSCTAMVLGSCAQYILELLSLYGAGRVIVAEDENLTRFSTRYYTDVLTGMISQYRPSVVLFGATHMGRDIAPRIAARLNTGLTADCTGLDVDNAGNLIQVRPTFGGDILATIVTPHHRPQMATVRPHVMQKQTCAGKKPIEVEPFRVSVKILKRDVQLINEVYEIAPFSNVEEADYVVSGGKGMGDEKNFAVLKELVRTLAGYAGESRVALGASRAAVDEGWIAHQHQVGQTGKTVTPKVYIACGISGQIQHLMGMRESEKIIAINRDRNAPIFRVADLGLVGDVLDVVPRLTKYLRTSSEKLHASDAR